MTTTPDVLRILTLNTWNRDGDYAISRDLVSAVEFSRVNLSEPAETRRFREVDIIFCRNLLIYFDDHSRRVAADAFYDALNPGGFVCLGHSESMSRISSAISRTVPSCRAC